MGIPFLSLLAYAFSAVCIVLPLVLRGKSADRRFRASGRFLAVLSLNTIFPSLQILLGTMGIRENLPGLWLEAVNLAFHYLILTANCAVALSWRILTRAFSPKAFPTDRFRRPVFLVLTCLTALNFITQTLGLLLPLPWIILTAEIALNTILIALLLAVLDGVARIYLPRRIQGPRSGTAVLRLIPAVPLIDELVYFNLPERWLDTANAAGIITVQVTALILFITQERDSGNSELTRDALFEESGLTAREREIALMLAEGLSYKEISTGLFISLSTVQTHVTRIYGKMGVNSKTELSMKLRV